MVFTISDELLMKFDPKGHRLLVISFDPTMNHVLSLTGDYMDLFYTAALKKDVSGLEQVKEFLYYLQNYGFGTFTSQWQKSSVVFGEGPEFNSDLEFFKGKTLTGKYETLPFLEEMFPEYNPLVYGYY